MLTLPDLKKKQLLVIQTEPTAKNRLFFKNENIVFEKDDEIINQASTHRVIAAFIVGDFTMTSGLIRECRKRAVSLFFLGHNLRLYGTLNAKADGNYLLRSAQYAVNQEKELEISKKIATNKIKNQIRLLKSVGKEKFSNENDFEQKIVIEIMTAKDNANLLGIEGNFSKIFFSEYFKEISWFRRMPRAKPDIPNLLLDIGYTTLFNFIDALLCLFGFDVYKGYYHKLFFQRKSLTCDIIEPFRCIIEKQLLKAYHLSQINEKDFFLEQNMYKLKYVQSVKYAKIFMETAMGNKEAIYLYVQKFYRFIMDQKNPFPEFNIITGKTQ